MFKSLNFKVILFGFIFTFFSSFGQSFFLGLFNPSIRDSLSITHGQFGSIYASATLLSSFILVWLGKKIDDIKLIKNEIIIKIKKDDTLNNILSPYFINRKIKNLIINEIGKEIKLKNLKINQKLFLYKNLNGVISKIMIPLDFSTDLIIDIFKDNVSGKKLKLDILKEYESKKFR
jgi:hypothetical protein